MEEIRMLKTRFLGSLLFLFGSTVTGPLLAQKITVEGRVVDKDSDLPLPFVTVFVNNTSKVTGYGKKLEIYYPLIMNSQIKSNH